MQKPWGNDFLLNIKNKLNVIFLQEEPGHSQSKPKFSNVKSSAVDLWEPLPILWAPSGLDSGTSLALSSMAHPAHLNELGQLHSRAAAVVRGHPTALASPNCWSLRGSLPETPALPHRGKLQP